ncbi:MAG: 50S ribosomal protein L31e, partial [Nanoarchaeota archaeon]|nr:50S ribosomal protein L31e [Nanoarchaeota archaeon]
MAAKKENKIVLERTYNIPLRRDFMHVPEYKRSKKAMKAVREFIEKHMKSVNVKLGRHLNMAVWARGIRHPPHHIKVVAKKDEEGMVKVELFGAVEDKPVVPLKAKKKGKKEDVLEEKVKEAKEEKAAEAKVVQH